MCVKISVLGSLHLAHIEINLVPQLRRVTTPAFLRIMLEEKMSMVYWIIFGDWHGIGWLSPLSTACGYDGFKATPSRLQSTSLLILLGYIMSLFVTPLA
jgi:hypothetical protein